MLVNLNIKNNKCQFEQCRHFDNGNCLDDKARKDCVDIAIAVLCVKDEVENEQCSRNKGEKHG